MKNNIDSKNTVGKTVAATVLTLLLTALSGCGTPSQEVAAPAAEPIGARSEPEGDSSQNESEDRTQQQDTGSAETQDPDSAGASDNGQESAPAGSFAPQSDSTLLGNVRTVGSDSFVVSQNFEMPAEVPGELIVVAPAEGSEDAVLVTVHVSEHTTYEIRIVKNGGVNGDSDVEKQAGSFSDLAEGNSLDIKGYYEGDDFHAEEIVIYRFA